jgi:hypothetical protein
MNRVSEGNRLAETLQSPKNTTVRFTIHW